MNGGVAGWLIPDGLQRVARVSGWEKSWVRFQLQARSDPTVTIRPWIDPFVE